MYTTPLQSKDGRQIHAILIRLITCSLSMIVASLILLIYSLNYWDNMPYDAPDDFDYSDVGQIQTIADGGEIAARINNATALERDGNLMFFSDMSKGFAGFSTVEPDATNIISLYPYAGSRSGVAIKILSTATDWYDTKIVHSNPIVEGQYYILYSQIAIPEGIGTIGIGFTVFVNRQLHYIVFEIKNNPTRFYYRDTGGNLVDISTRFNAGSVIPVSGLLKIKIDTVNDVISELTYNTLTVNALDIPLTLTDYSYDNDTVQADYYVYKNSGSNATGYVSNVVLTVGNN